LADALSDAESARSELTELKAENASLRTQVNEANRRAKEQANVLQQAETTLREAFKALSAEALASNNQAFIDLAKSVFTQFQDGAKTELDARRAAVGRLVEPLQQALTNFDAALRGIEKDRVEAYAGLKEQVVALRGGQDRLSGETAGLVKALRAPVSRGRWGEIQLRRVVEMAGMIENCDFAEQAHVPTEEGRMRPDVVVRLPGKKSTVVDSKVPLTAYLDAIEAKEETMRKAFLRDHARQVRNHVLQLSDKAYWDQLEGSPDFVVMYLPMESAFAAALQEDPTLIDFAIERSVIPAGPMTLLSHLKAAAYGWRQERIAANAEQISDLGKELYNRIATLAGHITTVGTHLAKTVDGYNSAVGSLERRVLIQARKFRELGAATREEIPELTVVDVVPRRLESSHLSDGQVPLGLPAETPVPDPIAR
jgi:DNA recombination protein RmuC